MRKNAYTCPILMQITAWIYCLRHVVFWNDGHVFRECRNDKGETWGVELSCVFPRWMIVAEWKLSGLFGRRVFYSLVVATMLCLCGCEGNPVESVTIGASPLGGFNITLTLKGGATMHFDNVPLDQAVAMQKKYRVNSRQVRWVTPIPRGLEACGCADTSRAISTTRGPQTITDTRGTVLWTATERRDLVRVVKTDEIVVKPSMRERIRNIFMLRSPHYIRDIKDGGDTPVSRKLRQCQLLDEPFAIDIPPLTHDQPPPDLPPANNGAPPSGEMKSLSLESRVANLEFKMDLILKAVQERK